MNETTRNLLLVGVLATIGYFIWKSTQTTTTVATSPTNPALAAGTNLAAPITGLVNSAKGYLDSQVLPSVQAGGLDFLHSVFGGNSVGSGGSLDNSGGNADDEG